MDADVAQLKHSNNKCYTSVQSRVISNTKIYQLKVEMQEKKYSKKYSKKYWERERERNNIFVRENYAKNGREYGWLNFEFEINQINKIVSQMCICIDEYVVQFSTITNEWSSDLIFLQELLIGIVIMWFWLEHQISFNLAEGWIENPWNRITMNLWPWAC